MASNMDDPKVIGECLWAAVDGPFFPDWEFSTLFGLAREEVREVAAAWPLVTKEENHLAAVNNSLNHLLSYPHGSEDAWREFISVSPAEVVAVYARWRHNRGPGCFADTFFDRLM